MRTCSPTQKQIGVVLFSCFSLTVTALFGAENRPQSGVQILDVQPEGPVARGEEFPGTFVAATDDTPAPQAVAFEAIRKAIDKKLKAKYGKEDTSRLKYERFEKKTTGDTELPNIALEKLKDKSVIRITTLWSYSYTVSHPLFKDSSLTLSAKVWVNSYLEPKPEGKAAIKLHAEKVEAVQEFREGPIAELLAKYANQLESKVFDFELDAKDLDLKVPESHSIEKVELDKKGVRVLLGTKKSS